MENISKPSKKTLNILIIAAIVCLIAASVAVIRLQKSSVQSNLSEYPQDELVIVNLAVGKADAAFLSYDGSLGMIDTGTKESYYRIKKFMDENAQTSMDYLIITHYDKDHVGGAVSLLQEYEVEKIYLPDYVSSKSGYGDIMEAVKGRDDVVFVSSEEQISVGDMTIQIIPPSDPAELSEDDDNMDNDLSLLCRVNFRSKKFLFTGDIEKDRIKQLKNDGIDLTADWIKIPHHGGYEDNSKKLLNLVSPKYSVISTGSERPADAELLTLLAEMGIKNFSTTKGDVVTLCDGEKIDVSVR
ncbi:ComEC/Rec2 family competence protein [Butyrivibrio sp. MC2021]|uniref:ComEC/Rec2 family competence protein n=1 Tax=Butyrivibrio sp. MC2021 TaxID=1408306 RepID=UPI00047B71CC|nr:MBL fold metallo-hydrolase [Butyrivibrio sp. MC2021]